MEYKEQKHLRLLLTLTLSSPRALVSTRKFGGTRLCENSDRLGASEFLPVASSHFAVAFHTRPCAKHLFCSTGQCWPRIARRHWEAPRRLVPARAPKPRWPAAPPGVCLKLLHGRPRQIFANRGKHPQSFYLMAVPPTSRFTNGEVFE